MVKRSRRDKEAEMDEKTTRMVLATAAVAAVAALLAGPAGATLPEGISGQAGGSQVASEGQALTGVHAALTRSGDDASPSGASVSLGLTGDSPLARVSAPEPEGLTGDGALTRVVADSTPTVTTSSGDDFDWASFGAGAGMVALVAAGLLGAALATRRRRTVGLS